jgi:hypothetical protein
MIIMTIAMMIVFPQTTGRLDIEYFLAVMNGDKQVTLIICTFICMHVFTCMYVYKYIYFSYFTIYRPHPTHTTHLSPYSPYSRYSSTHATHATHATYINLHNLPCVCVCVCVYCVCVCVCVYCVYVCVCVCMCVCVCVKCNWDKQVTLIEEVVEGVSVVRAVEREEAGEEQEEARDAALHYARTFPHEGGKKGGGGDKGVRVGSVYLSGGRRAPPGGKADDELEQGKCPPPHMTCKVSSSSNLSCGTTQMIRMMALRRRWARGFR